ncbi:ABC transporter permease [Bacillus wiedmannii]|uniref:ABC transporter permease n=1 Tax=Bacillus wiedmannii TaxID=1890302 RepID=UPI000BF04374|nr:ABC transporter permease [Bacillus wiedmannii]PEJ98845.1 ABC transporter permease [Bacillus wiedmannii]PEM24054.1 ABC transporter permease [Bacillus wiedmannii]PEP29645.1 ABC transporter permease [Bacillus wiedmannii]PFZ38354.1 ABC transporter permease [Bacillus wiedmannii]PGA86032.1 ABC transporter permease [Bacillus wiedmannii]
MNSFKIAYKLLKNNLKIYGLYFLVLVVTVATYYNFTAIQYNETFVQLTERLQSAVVASATSGFVLICTVIFFMWHANGFFLKQRQKETGLYMLMGISTSKIGRVLAIESILIGSLSLAIGLFIGILFSKLFLMFLGKAMMLEEAMPFSVSAKAIIQLVIVFGIIFVVLGVKNYRIVKKAQLINMLDAAKEKPSPPKYSYKKGFIGVLLIAAGYVIALNFKQWDLDLLLSAMGILILVSLGTYLFFGSSLTIILGKLTKSPKIIYKDVRLVSVSNIFFRQKVNYRSLAMTAILAAATVTAFSVSIAFKQFEMNHEITESPYSLSFESNSTRVKEEVKEVIRESKHDLIEINEIQFFIGQVEYVSNKQNIDLNNKAIITSYSQMKKTLEFLNYGNKTSILNQIKPERNEITFILNANTIASPIYVVGEEVNLNGKKFLISEYTQVPFTGNIKKYGDKNIYILNDSDYKELRKNNSEIVLNGVRITDEKESKEVVNKIKGIVPGGEENVNGLHQNFIWEYYALGPFFFLGLIMSLVFMLATFSTIYFKILSDAFTDKEQYSMLKKIGMSKKEVQRSVYLQVGIVFLLPVIVGMIHSVVAMNMLEQIMNVRFTLPILSGIGLFVLIMLAFYIGLCKNYTKLVYEG